MAKDISMSRLPVLYRAPRYYLALFALAYVLFVMIQKPRALLVSASENSEHINVMPSNRRIASDGSTDIKPKVGAIIANKESSRVTTSTPTVVAADEDQAPAAQAAVQTDAQTFRDRLAKSSSSEFEPNPGARAVAILQLSAMPVEQAVPALQAALKDGSGANRELAVRSMVRLARRYGDDNGVIRGALQQAAADSDVAVVQVAQSALAQVNAAIQNR